MRTRSWCRRGVFSGLTVIGLTACGPVSTPAPDGSLDATQSGDANAPLDAVPQADASRPEASTASAATCNPLAVTRECLPPYPSDFLTVPDPTSRTGLRLALPEGALTVPASATPVRMAPFDRADGFPTSAPIVVHFGVPVAPDRLVDLAHEERSLESDQPILLLDGQTGMRVPFVSEMDAPAMSQPERAALILRPLRPLEFGRRYTVVITDGLRAVGGGPLPVAPGFQALRDGLPISDARLVGSRQRYDEIFRYLATLGIARANVVLAWDYTTASREHVLGPILAMRQEVFARAAVTDGLPFTVDRVDNDVNANTARIVYGTFTPPNYLQRDNTVAYGADGRPALQSPPRAYPYTMVIPARARRESTPLPLLLFGHGVFGTGRDYLTGGIGTGIIQPLAESTGAVVVATDWIGLSGNDAGLILTDVVPDINRIGLVTDRLLQSLVNALSLLEISVAGLPSDPRVNVRQSPLVDASRVYYYGVSLGGIQGSCLFSVSRSIRRAVVTVPGASWSNILPRSVVYQPIKRAVDQRYPDPLTQTLFLSLIQASFDPTDGANLGRLAFREPPSDAPAERKLILQEAIGDCQVPHFSTEILARTLGLDQMLPAPLPVYGLTNASSPATTPVLTQYLMPDLLRSYTPPATNTVPDHDNGAHSGAVQLPNALQQVTDLFSTGQAVQHCSGYCDPD